MLKNEQNFVFLEESFLKISAYSDGLIDLIDLRLLRRTRPDATGVQRDRDLRPAPPRDVDLLQAVCGPVQRSRSNVSLIYVG
jgi:hypothetical protein